jgi:hypothetical protein
MSICDFLFSTDMLVPHPREAVAQMTRTIGLPPPGPSAYVDYEESGWDCVFALVNKSWSVGPTRLEVIGPRRYPGTPEISRGQSTTDVQGDKPCKTHATVIATSDLQRVVDHVRRSGLRHWLEDRGTDPAAFARLWMGVSASEPYQYEPDADAGLIGELIPSDSAAFTPRLFQRPPPEPVDPSPGQMIRILSRAFIVDNVDETLRTLETNLLWEAAGPAVDDLEAGYRFAVLSRNYEQGATLKLVQPLDATGPVGRFHRQWGPAPFTIRIAVHDLSAKAEDLASRGTGFVPLAPTEHQPARLAVDASETADMPFEFVEYGAAIA